jgi:predicted amidohydrolase
VVDPWGSILADGGITTGYIMADVDLSLVEVSQNKVPSLSNDRQYTKAF